MSLAPLSEVHVSIQCQKVGDPNLDNLVFVRCDAVGHWPRSTGPITMFHARTLSPFGVCAYNGPLVSELQEIQGLHLWL